MGLPPRLLAKIRTRADGYLQHFFHACPLCHVKTEHAMEEELRKVNFLTGVLVSPLTAFLKSKLWGIKLIVSTQFTFRLFLLFLERVFGLTGPSMKTVYYSCMVVTCCGIALMHGQAWEPGDYVVVIS